MLYASGTVFLFCLEKNCSEEADQAKVTGASLPSEI